MVVSDSCFLPVLSVTCMRLIVVCSWHVLSRDNIARVKRDEAEARALEAKKAEQVALAVSVLCGWVPSCGRVVWVGS